MLLTDVGNAQTQPLALAKSKSTQYGIVVLSQRMAQIK